jgi:hypothetical protein
MKILSKEELLANRGLPEDVVEVPELGGAVRVRGLSRKEFLRLNEGDDGYDFEDRALAAGMLEPKLTIEEVSQLRDLSPGMELQEVVMKINELSGVGKDAAKEAYKSL